MSLQRRFAEEMGTLLGPDFPEELVLAVSGGADSMAMLALAHEWARVWGVRLRVVTVDHGLRAESAEEARMVAAECALLGHEHVVLCWSWEGRGNKMDAARRGRLALIDAWRGAVRHVLLAHSRDDVAESFLMRLARGAGGDGLAAMAPLRALPLQPSVLADSAGAAGGMVLVRPCLGMSRAELRHHATVLKVPFVDDPSNADPRFDRARMRRLLALLEAEGLDRGALAGAAERLRADRDVLQADVLRAWEAGGAEHPGWLSLAPGWSAGVAPATRRRLLARMLRWVAGRDYAPRAAPLDALLDRVLSGGGGTLHGCEVAHLGGRVAVFREHAAICGLSAVGGLWDGRWQAPEAGGAVCALGDAGWQALDPAERAPLPHRIARVLPVVWRDGRPDPAAGPRWIAPGFTQFLMTH